MDFVFCFVLAVDGRVDELYHDDVAVKHYFNNIGREKNALQSLR